MPILVLAIELSLLLNAYPQTPSISEKEAVSGAQRVLASDLDFELPARPFADWFRQVVGPEAGVSWQLNECADLPDPLLDQDRILPACAEVNALLPDGRKVVVMIEVGTFKKGINGRPSFSHAAIEQQGELYRVRRLSELPEGLSEPAALARKNSIKLAPLDLPLPLLAQVANGSESPESASAVEEVPPPQPASQPAAKPAPLRETRNVSEDVLLGNAITKVQPLYPAVARKANASGPVEVQITISKEGHVIEARAIKGHRLLQRAAEEAALKWIFIPTILDGVPVQVQSILTFIFVPSR
jgi:TonB family protein